LLGVLSFRLATSAAIGAWRLIPAVARPQTDLTGTWFSSEERLGL
jgi:hypothetical protein